MKQLARSFKNHGNRVIRKIMVQTVFYLNDILTNTQSERWTMVDGRRATSLGKEVMWSGKATGHGDAGDVTIFGKETEETVTVEG
jgi:hypothetical protein